MFPSFVGWQGDTGSRWFQVVPGGSRWFKVVTGGSRWSMVVLGGARCKISRKMQKQKYISRIYSKHPHCIGSFGCQERLLKSNMWTKSNVAVGKNYVIFLFISPVSGLRGNWEKF